MRRQFYPLPPTRTIDARIYFQLTSFAHDQSRAATPGLKFDTLDDFNGEYSEDIYPEWSRYSG